MIITGNVIKSPGGGIWIVSNVTSSMIHATSFDHSNCSASIPIEDETKEQFCACGYCYSDDEEMDGISNDPDCEFCAGTGYGTIHQVGWGKSEVLAPNVREFIRSKMMSVFGL